MKCGRCANEGSVREEEGGRRGSPSAGFFLAPTVTTAPFGAPPKNERMSLVCMVAEAGPRAGRGVHAEDVKFWASGGASPRSAAAESTLEKRHVRVAPFPHSAYCTWPLSV